MPTEEAERDSREDVQTWPPPPLNYIRGSSAVHGDIDDMDIGTVQVEEILLSFGDNGNFHISKRAGAG
jgi:hypothetical protein